MDKIARIRALRGIGYGWSYRQAEAIDNGLQAPYFWRSLYGMRPDLDADLLALII